MCTSVEMKLSHSISCQRALVPKTGAIVPGFWSAFGFVACVVIVYFSKAFGHAGIMQREDYYDE